VPIIPASPKGRTLLRRFEAATDDIEINELAKELTEVRGARRGLERILRTHQNEETRAMAAWTLGMRFEERGAEKLAEAYGDPRETAYVRSYAAEALGHLLPYNEKARAYTPLLVGGLSEQSPEIRFWSCFALAHFKDKSAVPALQELLGDESEVRGWGPVKEEAEWAIAQIRGDTDFEAPWMKARSGADHRGQS
jgi:HEAT repeat protein